MPNPIKAPRKKTRADIAVTVFYNPDHPLNQKLKRKFGYYDSSVGEYRYNPSLSEIREHIRILRKK